MRVLLINGPNLNMLGKRELQIYGSLSLNEIHNMMLEKARGLGLDLVVFQSNCEGLIINKLNSFINNIEGIIINLAGYTHTSVASRDALMLFKNIPIIEVHLSNIYAREPFRRSSIIADIVTGQISGLGYIGYLLALDAIYQIHK